MRGLPCYWYDEIMNSIKRRGISRMMLLGSLRLVLKIDRKICINCSMVLISVGDELPIYTTLRVLMTSIIWSDIRKWMSVADVRNLLLPPPEATILAYNVHPSKNE